MLTIENVEIFGYKAAIRGMRNPMNSWAKSDSNADLIGQNDEQLMLALAKAPEERKYLRMIHVQFDVTAPLYWWKEFDTYKIGTVSNSCSTMHKIAAKEFTLDDFSHEHIGDVPNCDPMYYAALEGTIMALNEARRCFIDTKDKKFWWQMIQLLPSSYNQLRTVDLNYEVLLNQYFQRKDHKLDEWRIYCEQIKCFPYLNDFIEVLKNEQ